MIVFNWAFIIIIVLILAAFSGMFAERSGTINIAIDGMMIVGATIFWLMSRNLNGNFFYQLIDFLVAGFVAGLFGLLLGFASIHLRSNQIIAGTAINFLAAALALMIISFVGEDKKLLPEAAAAASTDPSSFLNLLNISTLLIIIIIGVVFTVFKYSKWGLRAKAAGENPQALASQGVSVFRVRYEAIFISGFLAGIAGSVFVLKQGSFSGNVNGLGFVGLAVLIAGQWKTLLIILVAIVFGIFYSIGENAQIISATLNDIQSLLQAVPFILSLFALVFFSKNALGPKSAGIPYNKNES